MSRAAVRISLRVLSAVCVLGFWGCAATSGVTRQPEPAPTAQFVLLADGEGHVGRITVASPAGEKTLGKDREFVQVAGASAPGETKILSEEELRRTFGPALDVLPPSPAKFILYFQPSSNFLTDESATEIDKVVAAIKSRVNADVSIAGHTDTVGSAEANSKLATERAKVIGELLRSKGIDISAFQVVSHGKNNPLVKTGDGVAEPKNRRVEVVVR